jgi:MbtH protein
MKAHPLIYESGPWDIFKRRTIVLREEELESRIYKVVFNHEEQYSIWPEERENPLGWVNAGKIGTKQECLSFIGEVWTDMRPLSLRRKMEGAVTPENRNIHFA